MKYVVQPWETWETPETIAKRFGISFEGIMQANPFLYSVPIYPGMMLTVPDKNELQLPPDGYFEYVVQPDDSFYAIASRLRLNWQKVIEQNPQIENPNSLRPGQVIYLVYSTLLPSEETNRKSDANQSE